MSCVEAELRNQKNALIIFLTAFCAVYCAPAASGRYAMATDPGSRYGFRYVQEKATHRWVNREFEIRVDRHRELPPLRVASEIGNSFTVQLFKPETAQSGGIFSAIPVVEGTFNVWRGADVADEYDLQGKVAYGVGVSWPQEGRETRHDPMEVFQLPRLGDTVPEEWSDWATAAVLRAGAMGWWDQTVGKPVEPAPAPEFPFEFRWRLVFTDVPGRVP